MLLQVLELALESLDLACEMTTSAEAGFPYEPCDEKSKQEPPDKSLLQRGVE